MRPTKHKSSFKDLAEKWGTTQMNLSNMAAKGCDFDAPDKDVAQWLLTYSRRKSKAMREAIDTVLKSDDHAGTSEAPEGENRSLEELRDYYAKKLSAATSAGFVDMEEVKFWNDLLLKVDESIRRSEAHSKKLGIDRGELLSREEVERIFRAAIWASNACCDKFSKQIAQRLSDKKPAEVHKILKPTLTGLTIFEGLRRVTKTPGDVNLPQWVVDCVQTERKLYLKP